jgi:hypothetical protein
MAGGLFCSQNISSEQYEQRLEKGEHDREEREKSLEKSFLVDAVSYELEGGRTLKAVLRDESGRERVSKLDLNKCIDLDLHDLKYRESKCTQRTKLIYCPEKTYKDRYIALDV